MLAGQLSRIVGYIDQLQRFETAQEETSAEGREAEDRPHECLPREQLLANAPAGMDGFLLVPEVQGVGDGSGGNDGGGNRDE